MTMPERKIWAEMIRRCHDPSNKSFHNYRQRGIQVCAEWRGSDGFTRFLAHIGKRPSPAHSLDRYPDNDGNYEPGNVRWATRKEQNNNRRDTVYLTFKGERLPREVWTRRRGFPENLIRDRMEYLGWSVERVLTTPVKKTCQNPRKGVSEHGDRYTARITVNNHTYNLGRFKTVQEAGAAYDARARELGRA